MALHLITGYAGTEHITSADQGAYNMGTFGEGEFVLDRGSKFAATVASNNSITIADGEALMQGRFIKLPVGTTESVSIDNGSSGMKRKDLIVLRYTKDSNTGVETAAFAVKKGTPSSSTPSDPSITTGNITDGTDLVNEMKLYRVNIDGLNITAVDTLFSTKYTMVEYMDSYQLPIATASRLGGVKIGDGINVDGAGIISLKTASENQKGGVKVFEQGYSYISNENRVYMDNTGVLKLNKPRVKGDYDGSSGYFALDSSFSVPSGISERKSSITLSSSASADLRERIGYSRNIEGLVGFEFYMPASVCLTTSASGGDSVYLIYCCGIDVEKTGKCYVYSPSLLYNPKSSSVTVTHLEIGY